MKAEQEKKLMDLGNSVLAGGYNLFQLVKGIKSNLNDKYQSLSDLCNDAVEESPESIQTLKSNIQNASLNLTDMVKNGARDRFDELSELLTSDGLEKAYHKSIKKGSKIAYSLKNIYNNFVNNFRFNIRTAAVYSLVLLSLASCAFGPTIQPNYLKGKESLLQERVLTTEELKKLKGKFDQNHTQYSQELFDISLAKMNQICHPFAKEYAQNPELNDEISPSEAKGTYYICMALDKTAKKSGGIPPDLFEEKAKHDMHKIILEWHGNSKEKSDWGGFITSGVSETKYLSKVLDAKPVNFEPNDAIYYEFLKEYGTLKWKSTVDSDDTDGLMVTLKYPAGDKVITLSINDQSVSFTKAEIFSKNHLSFNENNGLEGTLIIKNASETNLSPELYTIRDMVLAGEGDYKCSSALRALLEKYKIGDLKEGDNPFENYRGPVEFVGPILDSFKGTEKDNFEYIVSWLKTPELIDYYEKGNFTYEHWLSGSNWMTTPESDPKFIFKRKSGNCVAYAFFTDYCLSKAGYKAWIEYIIGSEDHVAPMFKTEKGTYILDNAYFRRESSGLKGPFNSVGEARKQFK